MVRACRWRFVALLLLAAALASAQQKASVLVQDTRSSDGSMDIAIDVTEAFADQLGDDRTLQVNVTLEVVQRMVYVNQHAVPVDQLSSLRLVAFLYEKMKSTGALVAQRPASVVVVLSVASGPNALVVQEMVREIDGSRIETATVQQAVVTLDAAGNEEQRTVTAIGLAESRITTTTTSTTTVSPSEDEGDAPASSAAPEQDGSPNSPDSPDSPDSPSPSAGHRSSRHHCRLCMWFHRQSFGVRVLVSAAFSFVSVLVLYLLYRTCVACCCAAAARRRDVYLGNVKMHYEPLPTEDKKSVIV